MRVGAPQELGATKLDCSKMTRRFPQARSDTLTEHGSLTDSDHV